MYEATEFVSLERVGDKTYFNMSCAYPHEICLFMDEKSIKRIASLFISLGKGKRKARLKLKVRSEDLCFPLTVTADHDNGKHYLRFEYAYYNSEFDSVSESYTDYCLFSKEALWRFGKELSEFDRTNKALLIEN